MYHVNPLRFLGRDYLPLTAPQHLDKALDDTQKRLRDRYNIELDIAAVRDQLSGEPVLSRVTLYDAIMSVLWLRDEREHWAEKCQLLWREIPEFIEGSRNGRAILVLRDPRSVVASFKRYTHAQAPLYLGAVFNCLDAMMSALRYEKELPPDRFMILRYEDVARDPSAWAEKMFGFLDLDPSRADLDPSRWKDSVSNTWVANSSFDDGMNQFDVEAAIGRWRTKLSALEVAFTEYVCGDSMQELGYKLEGEPLDWPDILSQILENRAVTSYLRGFLKTGRGIEAFPSDPLDSATWEENRKT